MSKEFKCDLCEYSSVQRSNLAEHVDTVHLKLRKFACDRCEARFARRYRLTKHVADVHWEDENEEGDFGAQVKVLPDD
jgi:KRAB domain-containing zinc finger protein